MPNVHKNYLLYFFLAITLCLINTNRTIAQPNTIHQPGLLNEPVNDLETAIQLALHNKLSSINSLTDEQLNNIDPDELKNDITKDVKLYWFELITAYQKSIIYEKELEGYDKLTEINSLLYKYGELSSIENSHSNIQYLDKKLKYIKSLHNYYKTYSELQTTLLTKDTIIPNRTTLNLYQIDRSGFLTSNYLKESNNDSIVNNQIKINALRTELEALFAQYRVFEDELLFELQNVTDLTELKYHEQDAEYTEFLEVFSLAIKINIEYLEIIKNYNQTAVLLEYYLKSKLHDAKNCIV